MTAAFSSHVASCSQQQQQSDLLVLPSSYSNSPPLFYNQPTLRSVGQPFLRRKRSSPLPHLSCLGTDCPTGRVETTVVIQTTEGHSPGDVLSNPSSTEEQRRDLQRWTSGIGNFVFASAESTDQEEEKTSSPQCSHRTSRGTSGLSRVDRQFNWPLDRLAFGSCSKQKVRDQSIWKAVSRRRPSAWIWTGDSIYSRCSEPECIERGYVEQSEKSGGYRKFIEEASQPCSEEELERAANSTDNSIGCSSVLRAIDGTWDDHDYGLNDGGKHHKHKDRAQKLFLDFLGISKDDIIRRNRRGVYSAHLFGSEASQQVKLILLDTRFHRDNHFIPSLGSYIDNGLVACVAAAIRWATKFVGVGVDYDGDLLGEEQWAWLEAQLTYGSEGGDEGVGSPCDESAAVHVIVSSIQIMTGFSVVESWGHFPRARRRLFNLLKKTKPRGLVFLSGDVHYGEILGEVNGVSEITSSGLTHSLGGELLASPIMGWGMLLNSFGDTRDHAVGISKAVYTGKNFGLLDFKYGHQDVPGRTDAKTPEDTVVAKKTIARQRIVEMQCSVVDTNGQTRLSVKQTFNYDDRDEREARIWMLDEIPELIPRRSTWSSMGRGCSLGLLVFWAAQVAVLLVVLGGRRLAGEWNLTGASRMGSCASGPRNNHYGSTSASTKQSNQGHTRKAGTDDHEAEDGLTGGGGAVNKLRKRKGKGVK
eukprot:GHVS01083441.1.p1 GENE.GHVS01083441.1~~GHVS01083441.1.p1  ORF type:complete len:708 (-),score=89.74 GHVS01083441.1:261-2360(-)